MTYDEWKSTDTTPEPERTGWCDKCEHYECGDCRCCSEEPDSFFGENEPNPEDEQEDEDDG